MPRRPQLTATASAALLALGVSSCDAARPVAERGRAIGAELLAQEVPPGFRRPTREDERLRLPPTSEPPGRYAFYWTRAIYSDYGRGRGWGRRGSWSTDFPKGDRQFLIVLKRLVRLDAYDWENAVSLSDPMLRHFPVIYAVEVGRMMLSDAEIEGLRGFLQAGGFLIVDDFWGPREWAQFEYNINRVLPDRAIVELPLDHEIFRAYYDITEIKQVPNISNARWGSTTTECWGCEPHVLGIHDAKGRLMVVINFNTDLGDAWEWAEDPDYPLEYSTYAYEMGANMIVYGMSR